MDAEGPLKPAPERHHYFNVIFDHFRVYIATVATQKKNAQFAVKAIIYHWISTFGPPQYLNTDRGTESFSSERARCCTLFNLRHSLKTHMLPGQMDLLKYKTKILDSFLECFCMIPLRNGLFMYISLLMLTIHNQYDI